MADLRVSYMGVPLRNPIVVGACSLSKKVDVVKHIEEAGAGGLVIKSLFEEQIQLERGGFDTSLTQFDNTFAEALTMFPQVEHGGAKEHLFWLRETRKAVSMPLFASLNAVNRETWVEWAKQLEDTGVNGIELNFYSPPLDPTVSSSSIEKEELETFVKVRAAVRCPLAVKLHPHYTSLLNVASNYDKAGANALVLFNRLFQPDLDLDTGEKLAGLRLSEPNENLLPLRWTALLSERIQADVISSTGIYTGKDALKMIMCGASAVQVVSALYKNKVDYVQIMVDQMNRWMDAHNYENIMSLRGKAAKKKADDAWSFERGQYIKAVLGVD